MFGMHLSDWRLPRGVSRSLWEFAQDPAIPRQEAEHLAGSSLPELDRRVVERWFTRPGDLVDLGCGGGRLLTLFAERGFSVVGVDLSIESLRMARGQAAAQGVAVAVVRANLCDGRCLPAAAFDYALMMFGTLGMIAGAENRAAALADARRMLKPGGSLALHVHNIWRHAFNPAGRRWLIRDRARWLCGARNAGDTYADYRGIPNMHHHPFTWGELRQLLGRNGFAIREIVCVGHEGRGWLAELCAEGWLVRAEAVE